MTEKCQTPPHALMYRAAAFVEQVRASTEIRWLDAVGTSNLQGFCGEPTAVIQLQGPRKEEAISVDRHHGIGSGKSIVS